MANELDRKLKRFLLNVASFVLIFILYASLLPFNFTTLQFDTSFSGFLFELQLSTVSAEPGKWIGHLIFNSLLFFIVSLYCRFSKAKFIWIWMFTGVFLFGVLVEYFQMFIGNRGTSLVDIYANMAGIVIGFLLALFFGRFTIDALRYFYQYETLPLNVVRKLYLAFVIAIILFPYDFFITPLQFELAFATKGLPFFENETSVGIGSLALLAAVLLTFPLGILYRLSGSRKKRRSSRTRQIIAGFGILFLLLETLQFFEVSGQSSFMSFLCKYVGFLIGFSIGKFFDLKIILEMALKLRLLIFLGLIVFVWLALRIKGFDPALPLSMAASMDVIAGTSFLPFMYYIDVGSGEALLSFLLNFVIFIPLGAFIALQHIARDNFRVISFTRLMGIGFFIAIIFEALVLIWGLKRPDVTNILVAAFAMPMGYYLVIMCLNSISKKLSSKVHQLS